MMWLALSALVAASAPAQDDRALMAGEETPFPPEHPSLAAPLSSDVGDEWFQLRGRYWFARMSGNVEADAATKGGRLAVSSDLDLGGQTQDPEIQAYFHIPYVGRIYVGWWRYLNSADPTLSKTFDFAGRTFTAGTQVHTSMELNTVYLTYEFPFPKISLGDPAQLELALQIGVQGFGADATISDGGVATESRGTIGMLFLGGHATAQITPWIRAEVEAQGMALSVSNESFSYVQVLAEVVAQPLPWLFAGVGYKYLKMTYGYHARLDFDLDFELSGVYVTAGVRF